jgi:FkbM family methyltransferase
MLNPGSILARVLKPWYVYRPMQVALRLKRVLFPPASYLQEVVLPWGYPITIDIRENVGVSIWTAGVFDLTVSEILYRLSDPGACTLDIGANIGFMTSLLSYRVGPAGSVHAFEPQPQVFDQLQQNVRGFQKSKNAGNIHLSQLALSDSDGEATLVMPSSFQQNRGLARIGIPKQRETGVQVTTRSLDSLPELATAILMKIDVEGHEEAVFHGARSLLRRGTLKHIVYEAHEGLTGGPSRLLLECGYHLFRTGWELRGPLLGESAGPKLAKSYEAPSYLATLDPAVALARCAPRGWQVLRSSSRDRD